MKQVDFLQHGGCMQPGRWFVPMSLMILSAAARGSNARTGIFEPINYSQDINLTDVFFVNADVGWVSGEHATILNTVDGGKTWNAQVGGEPDNNDHPIRALRFFDATHGWAVLEDRPERFLRTDDGQSWNEVGVFDAGTTIVDYAFTSLQQGVALGSNGSVFYSSSDGGRHWERRGACQLRATVQGLARTEDCRFRKLQAVSARTAYVLVDWSGGHAFLRTDDGGEHWASTTLEISDCCDPDFFFTTPDSGTLYFNNGKTYVTADSARSWRPLLSGGVGLKTGGRPPPVRFADPQVGWVLGKSPDNSNTFRVSFTTDGGQHWKLSGNIAFPAEWGSELHFSLPGRDRAYVVGRHGMIYRYSVVAPSDRPSKALAAPAMPVVDVSSLSAQALRVRNDVDELKKQIAASTDPTTSTPGPGTPAANDSAATPSVQNGDAAPAIRNCCAPAVQALEADVTALSQNAPQLATRFRSLNLVIAGLQSVTNLMAASDSLKGSVSALKEARSPKMAADALQQLASATDSAEQAVLTALRNPGASLDTSAASQGGADAQQTTGTVPAPAETTASAPQDSAANQSSNSQPR